MKNPLFLTLPLILLVSGLYGQSTRIEEYTETIKTYPFSNPDPFPIINRYNEIYPYFRFDGFSHDSKPMPWKMIKMENDHIILYILPDMGGKLWGAIDKKTGKEFIYKNDVIKFRDVAQRGPWTSGGIEFNSGVIGHHAGNATPVDYTYFTDDDGTAHCVIGGTDLPSHTTWRVDISLPPDKAWFETKTSWFNSSPFHQAYYYWSNAAVKSADDLHFYFPGTHWLGHDGLAHPWPVNEEGIDRSWYKNNRDNEASSYHVLGSTDNYYVSFFHDERFGSAHWSPVWGTPGKKIWLWPQSRSGAIWEDLLTDNHGQYVEVQAGRMFNQNSFSSAHTPFKQTAFQPFNAESWMERWFPVSDMSGITRAMDIGAVLAEVGNEGLSLEFCPNEKIDGRLAISVKGKTISEEHLQLAPSQTFSKKYPEIHEKSGILITFDGKTLYDAGAVYRMTRPVKSQQDVFTDRLTQGREYMYRRDYMKALEAFEKFLEKEPLSLEALANLAEIQHYRGLDGRSFYYCRKALSINAYDPHTNFIFADISMKNGNTADAEDGFRFAMRDPEYRSPALTLMARMRLKAGRYGEAADLALEALNFNARNLAALKILAMAYREAGYKAKAEQTLARLLALDPLNHFALFEKYLLSHEESVKNDFTNSFNNEMAKEEYLELGIDYAKAGQKEAAIEVLKHAPPHPVTDYWLASLTGDKAYLDKALAADPAMVFPFRTETLEVLRQAKNARKSWKTDYYQALILWNRGRNEEALAMLKTWGDEPDFAPFYFTRANLAGITTDEALSDMNKALAVSPGQWRLYRDLCVIHQQRREYEKALEVIKKGHDRFPENFIIDILQAHTLALLERNEESLKTLAKINVLPFEGENRAQNVYVHDNLMLALGNFEKGKYKKTLQYLEKSELYPENLGSGSPSYPDYRAQRFIRATVYEKQGKKDLAQQEYGKILKYYNPNMHGPGSPRNRLARIFALIKSGKTEEGKKLADAWANQDKGYAGRWVKAVMENDEKSMTALKKEWAAGVKSPNASLTMREIIALSSLY